MCTVLTPLPQSFFAREALVVARALLGKLLVRGDVVLRISEVEAYRHPGDSANHCRFGRTTRNAPMWGAPGHAYVYLCYGMHALLNLVTDGEGEGAAVLVRAAEAVAGHDVIAARRRCALTPSALAGPGKVAQALAVDVRVSGLPLVALAARDAPALHVCDAPYEALFRAGPRIGIDYASAADRAAPWRLALHDSRAVTQPKLLSLWDGTDDAFLRAQTPRPARRSTREGLAITPRRTRSSPL